MMIKFAVSSASLLSVICMTQPVFSQYGQAAVFTCPQGYRIETWGPYGNNQSCRKLPEAPQPRGKSCADVFVGGNLDNSGLTLVDKEFSSNLHSTKYATRTWHGGIRNEWTGSDRYWSDSSSARVYEGCTLKVFTGDNFDGSVLSLPGQGNSNTDFIGTLFPFANNVGTLQCTCGVVADIQLMLYVAPLLNQ